MVNRVGVILVLLLALLWQSLALARAGSSISAVADPAHAVLHWQDEAHHHHDDGSHHVDDSAESAQHLAADHAGGSVALLPTGSDSLVIGNAAPSASRGEVPSAHPYLDGLLRPPRLSA